MNKDKIKNLTVIDCKPVDIETEEKVIKEVYQSNPMKTDLYSRLAAFRQSQKKFTIKDAIKDSLK